MQYTNPVKTKLKNGESAFFAMVRFPNPITAQVIARSGVDSICIDNEHFPFTDEQICNIVRAVHQVGIECTIRPNLKEHNYIYKLLDMGIDGFLFANVESAEELKTLISAAKYPPEGTRGCCPITAGAQYGVGINIDEYYKKKNDTISIGVMIESQKGIANIQEIMAVPGIDYFAVGPSDMSGSFGRPGKASDPDIKASIDDLHKTVISAGFPVESLGYSVEQAKKDYAEGKKVFNIGSDLQMLTKKYAANIQAVRDAIKEFGAEYPDTDAKTKLSNKKPVVCSFVRIADPGIAELAARSGVDFVTLDDEHFPYTDRELYNSIVAVHLAGKSCVVRVHDKSRAYIGRMLDLGADGILAPQVESAEEVEAIIQAVKYAPRGKRGYCPISACANFGYGYSPATFSEVANKKTIVGIMIETKGAVEDLDKILALDGLDYISIGPSDLSASYGYPGDYEVKEVKEAIEYATKASLASKCSVSAQCYDKESALKALKEGMNMFNVGSDLQFLIWGFDEHVGNMKKAF